MKNVVPWPVVRDRLPKPPNLEERVAEKLRDWQTQRIGNLDLPNLRKHLDSLQTELAKRLGITQSQLSRFERRRDHRVSSLRKYIEALGGRLEIIAVFPDERIRLKDV